MEGFIRKSVQQMTAYVPGEQPSETGVIKLNTNENPYPPSPVVVKTLSEMGGEMLKFYPNPESRNLRKKISEIHKCEISNVFVGNGSDELLALCTRAFVENNGSIGYYDPSYSLYPVLADIRDVEKKPVGLDKEYQAGPLPDGYDCSLFFLTNPNAPTGILSPEDRVRGLCESISGVMLIDEAYVDFAKEHQMNLALEYDNVLVARSFSKSYSLAGLRVGYAVGSSILVDALYKVKDSYNVNMISQNLALVALSDIDYMYTNVEKIKNTRARLSKELSDIGYEVYPSEANFLWVRPEGITAKELFERLRKQRILIRYFAGEQTGDCVRITIGTDEEIDKLIKAVKEIARKN
ncbi:histidinol-phosphate transaminase [Verrucomicrobiota bacterium]